MELVGKRYRVRGKRKVLAEYAFKADAEQKFEELCKKHWKRSFYIVDTLTGKCIEDRHVFTY